MFHIDAFLILNLHRRIEFTIWHRISSQRRFNITARLWSRGYDSRLGLSLDIKCERSQVRVLATALFALLGTSIRCSGGSNALGSMPPACVKSCRGGNSVMRSVSMDSPSVTMLFGREEQDMLSDVTNIWLRRARGGIAHSRLELLKDIKCERSQTRVKASARCFAL